MEEDQWRCSSDHLKTLLVPACDLLPPQQDLHCHVCGEYAKRGWIWYYTLGDCRDVCHNLLLPQGLLLCITNSAGWLQSLSRIHIFVRISTETRTGQWTWVQWSHQKPGVAGCQFDILWSHWAQHHNIHPVITVSVARFWNACTRKQGLHCEKHSCIPSLTISISKM